jgi:hypothetical protein
MNRYFVLYIIIICLSIPTAYSQKERIEYLPNFDKRTLHFGYYLGINNNSFEVNYWDQTGHDPNSPVFPTPDQDMFVSVDASLGFNIGFVVDYRLHKNINLRFEPGLMSNSKTITFIDPNLDPYPLSTTETVREIAGTYLHLPLLLKFSTNRLNNIRPYIIGGVSYDYNFSSNEKNGEDNFYQEFRMTSNNFMYEVGFGVDFYMYFFKFTPSIRGIFAINNELVEDSNPLTPGRSSPWTGPVDFLGTRGLFLNLTFE